MAKYGALAGAAVAAVGALCSYEAHVLHLHSSPGDGFQVSITEVLGCKEGSFISNSQTEMITAACGSSTPICNGPNSFETLLFAPRY
jgi:hypothetical protein